MVRADKIRRLMTKRHVALGLRTVRKKKGRPAGELYDTYVMRPMLTLAQPDFIF
jgi:hypothetical protein